MVSCLPVRTPAGPGAVHHERGIPKIKLHRMATEGPTETRSRTNPILFISPKQKLSPQVHAGIML